MRQYGPYKKGTKKDDGTPRKKPGRKKGFQVVTKPKVEQEINLVVNYMTYGKKTIKNKINKEVGCKPNTPLTQKQACREIGIHPNTFISHLNRYPRLKEAYYELKDSRREYLKELAESNMVNVLEEGDLTDKEKFDASFKVAQATIKQYNPKIETENKNISINLSKTSEDLKADLAELLGL